MSLTFEMLGFWKPYTPDTIPDGFPPGAVFLQNATGEDWYAKRRELIANPVDGAVYMTAIPFRGGPGLFTQAIQRDLSMVFPANSMLVRVLGVDPADPKPWAALEQQIFDPRTLTLSAPPPILPTSCSKLGLKRAFDEKGLWSTVRAMIAARPDMQEDWDLAVELRISDPIVQKAVAGLALLGIALSPDDVQALVTRANELVA